MDIHNTREDFVVDSVQKIFDEIQEGGNPEKLCLCYQCRIDTICFTLNRIEPHYIASNRGFSRIDPNSLQSQQMGADITTLIYKAIRLVNHNQRAATSHDDSAVFQNKAHSPLFDIPTISGRIFNGVSFEPVVGIDVSLYLEGELVKMRNSNWQNPYQMVTSTPGVYSFWPTPIIADKVEVSKEFQFSLRISAADYEPFNHFFSVKAISRFHTPHSYTMNKTYKLPDLYIFPPGGEDEEEQ